MKTIERAMWPVLFMLAVIVFCEAMQAAAVRIQYGMRVQAAAIEKLAAAQEADTELTRRYYHALEDAEGER